MPSNNNSTFTNNTNTTDTDTLIINGQTYTLARSGTFYYLQFINYDKELFKNASNLTSKPTIIFYNDGTSKAIVDYSLASTTDKLYINSFFANLTPNTDGFNVTKGQYLDTSGLEADVTCGLTFTSYTDYKAFAKVVSVTNQNSALDVYFGDYFVNTPQLSKSGSLGYNESTIDYALVSVNPSTAKPLSYLGITSGDAIEVVNSSSLNTGYKFLINEITTVNNKEVLRLTPVYSGNNPNIESLIGQTSTVNIYVKGTTTSTADFDGVLGCCVNKSTYDKIDNSTEYQCSIRSSNYGFSIGTCASIPNTTSQSSTTIISNTYDTRLEVLSSNIVFESTITNLNEATPQLNLTLTKGDSSYLFNNKISLVFGQKYCFSQTDATNNYYTIRFSTTPDTFTPYVGGIYGGVSYRGTASNQFLNAAVYEFPVLYIFLESSKNLNSTNKTPEYIKTNYYLSI